MSIINPVSLPSQEKQYYDFLFEQAGGTKNGELDGSLAAALLSKTALSQDCLCHIWELCDQEAKGSLTRPQFYLAMKLVTMTQCNFINPLDPMIATRVRETDFLSVELPNLPQLQIPLTAIGSSDSKVDNSSSSSSVAMAPISASHFQDDDDDFGDFTSAPAPTPAPSLAPAEAVHSLMAFSSPPPSDTISMEPVKALLPASTMDVGFISRMSAFDEMNDDDNEWNDFHEASAYPEGQPPPQQQQRQQVTPIGFEERKEALLFNDSDNVLHHRNKDSMDLMSFCKDNSNTLLPANSIPASSASSLVTVVVNEVQSSTTKLGRILTESPPLLSCTAAANTPQSCIFSSSLTVDSTSKVSADIAPTLGYSTKVIQMSSSAYYDIDPYDNPYAHPDQDDDEEEGKKEQNIDDDFLDFSGPTSTSVALISQAMTVPLSNSSVSTTLVPLNNSSTPFLPPLPAVASSALGEPFHFEEDAASLFSGKESSPKLPEHPTGVLLVKEQEPDLSSPHDVFLGLEDSESSPLPESEVEEEEEQEEEQDKEVALVEKKEKESDYAACPTTSAPWSSLADEEEWVTVCSSPTTTTTTSQGPCAEIPKEETTPVAASSSSFPWETAQSSSSSEPTASAVYASILLSPLPQEKHDQCKSNSTQQEGACPPEQQSSTLATMWACLGQYDPASSSSSSSALSLAEIAAFTEHVEASVQLPMEMQRYEAAKAEDRLEDALRLRALIRELEGKICREEILESLKAKVVVVEPNNAFLSNLHDQITSLVGGADGRAESFSAVFLRDQATLSEQCLKDPKGALRRAQRAQRCVALLKGLYGGAYSGYLAHWLKILETVGAKLQQGIDLLSRAAQMGPAVKKTSKMKVYVEAMYEIMKVAHLIVTTANDALMSSEAEEVMMLQNKMKVVTELMREFDELARGVGVRLEGDLPPLSLDLLPAIIADAAVYSASSTTQATLDPKSMCNLCLLPLSLAKPLGMHITYYSGYTYFASCCNLWLNTISLDIPQPKESV